MYCVAHVGQKTLKCRNFDQIFTLWRTLVPIPLYQFAPNFSGNSRPMFCAYTPDFIGICLLCHLPGMKNAILSKVWHLGGSCSLPSLPMRAKFGRLEQAHGLCLHVNFCLNWFILLPSGGKKICRFLDFSILWWQQSEKVEYRCTTTNLPMSSGIKIISVLQSLHGKIGHTDSDVQRRNGQKMDNKTLNVFGRPVAGEIQVPPNLAWW